MAEEGPSLSLSNQFCDTNTRYGDTTVSVCEQRWESVSFLPHRLEAGSLEEDAKDGKGGKLPSYYTHTNMNRAHQT